MIFHLIPFLLILFPVTVQSIGEKEIDNDLDEIQMRGCDFWTYGPKIKEICDKIKANPEPYLPRIKTRLSLPDDEKSMLSQSFRIEHSALLHLLQYINSDGSKSLIRESFRGYMTKVIHVRNEMEKIKNSNEEVDRARHAELQKAETVLLGMRVIVLSRLIVVKDNGLIDYCLENLEKEDHGTRSQMIGYLYAVPQTESDRAKVLTSLERIFADPNRKLSNDLYLERIIAKMKTEWKEQKTDEKKE